MNSPTQPIAELGQIDILTFTIKGNDDIALEIAGKHLINRLHQTDEGHRFGDFWESLDDLPYINDSYVASGGNFFVAWNGEDIAGFCGLMPDAENPASLTLKRMATMNGYKRRGIGTAVVQYALQWAADYTTATTIHLMTNEEKEHALPIYVQAGFVEDGPDCRQPSSSGTTNIFMRFDLAGYRQSLANKDELQ